MARETGCKLPRIFNNCTTVLPPEKEKEARDLYWRVITTKTEFEQREEAERDLKAAVTLNPFIAEPHTVLAQIYNFEGRYEEATEHATEALRLFKQWNTCWDKRY